VSPAVSNGGSQYQIAQKAITSEVIPPRHACGGLPTIKTKDRDWFEACSRSPEVNNAMRAIALIEHNFSAPK
jgi:hypothetical protein